MLTLLPALILLVMGVAIAVLYQFRPNFGTSWLMAIGAGVVSLGLFIYFHWFPPAAIGENTWLPVSQETQQILFKIDSISWSYGVSLLGLMLAALLTAPVRLQYRSNPITWAGILAIAGATLLGILAATPLSIILTWTVLDLTELIVTLGFNVDPHVSRSAVISLIFRLAGTALVVWAMGVSRAGGMQLLLENANPQAAFFLLLAVGLRLGVLPLSLPYLQETLRRRGIGTMLRLAGPAASLGILARLPATAAPQNISPYLLGLAALAVLYGAGMWLAAKDEVEGRQYWVIALAGMAVGAAVRGQPQASLAWGVTMMVSGGVLFFYSTRTRFSMVLPVLGLLGLTGLPFTPAASGWNGLVVLPFTLPDLLFIFAEVLLILGYIRHFIRPGDAPSEVERWPQATYILGLVFLVAIGWLIGIFAFTGSFTSGIWWASMIPSLIAALAGILYLVLKRRNFDFTSLREGWLMKIGSRVGGITSAVLRLNWLYRLLWLAFNWLERGVRLMTEMLEGAGGVLWVLVLVVLVITFVQAGLK